MPSAPKLAPTACGVPKSALCLLLKRVSQWRGVGEGAGIRNETDSEYLRANGKMGSMTIAPSVSNSITVRLELPARATAVSELTTAIEATGGLVTGLDVTASGPRRLQVDVTIATRGTEHVDEIEAAMRTVDGVEIGKVSDRTFLMHLGGMLKIESTVPIRTRDDLSMVYTPGVARVCMAIAENPQDARRLTIKRNTVAVVTDGSAVLGLGNIGPAACRAGYPGLPRRLARHRDRGAGGFAQCLAGGRQEAGRRQDRPERRRGCGHRHP